MANETETEMANLNKKRRMKLQEVKAKLEEIINDVELFCPYDIIVLQQGSVRIYSLEVLLPLITED